MQQHVSCPNSPNPADLSTVLATRIWSEAPEQITSFIKRRSLTTQPATTLDIFLQIIEHVQEVDTLCKAEPARQTDTRIGIRSAEILFDCIKSDCESSNLNVLKSLAVVPAILNGARVWIHGARQLISDATSQANLHHFTVDALRSVLDLPNQTPSNEAPITTTEIRYLRDLTKHCSQLARAVGESNSIEFNSQLLLLARLLPIRWFEPDNNGQQSALPQYFWHASAQELSQMQLLLCKAKELFSDWGSEDLGEILINITTQDFDRQLPNEITAALQGFLVQPAYFKQTIEYLLKAENNPQITDSNLWQGLTQLAPTLQDPSKLIDALNLFIPLDTQVAAAIKNSAAVMLLATKQDPSVIQFVLNISKLDPPLALAVIDITEDFVLGCGNEKSWGLSTCANLLSRCGRHTEWLDSWLKYLKSSLHPVLSIGSFASGIQPPAKLGEAFFLAWNLNPVFRSEFIKRVGNSEFFIAQNLVCTTQKQYQEFSDTVTLLQNPKAVDALARTYQNDSFPFLHESAQEMNAAGTVNYCSALLHECANNFSDLSAETKRRARHPSILNKFLKAGFKTCQELGQADFRVYPGKGLTAYGMQIDKIFPAQFCNGEQSHLAIDQSMPWARRSWAHLPQTEFTFLRAFKAVTALHHPDMKVLGLNRSLLIFNQHFSLDPRFRAFLVPSERLGQLLTFFKQNLKADSAAQQFCDRMSSPEEIINFLNTNPKTQRVDHEVINLAWIPNLFGGFSNAISPEHPVHAWQKKLIGKSHDWGNHVHKTYLAQGDIRRLEPLQDLHYDVAEAVSEGLVLLDLFRLAYKDHKKGLSLLHSVERDSTTEQTISIDQGEPDLYSASRNLASTYMLQEALITHQAYLASKKEQTLGQLLIPQNALSYAPRKLTRSDSLPYIDCRDFSVVFNGSRTLLSDLSDPSARTRRESVFFEFFDPYLSDPNIDLRMMYPEEVL